MQENLSPQPMRTLTVNIQDIPVTSRFNAIHLNPAHGLHPSTNPNTTSRPIFPQALHHSTIPFKMLSEEQ
jgi:hypothetical protein